MKLSIKKIESRLLSFMLTSLPVVGAVVGLASCTDLTEPAMENNQEISAMYEDADFARGLLDNAYLVLPYDGSPSTDVATDDAVTNDNSNNYLKMATGNWTSSSNPINQWDVRQHAIQYCNIMIANADKVKWAYSSDALNQMFIDIYYGQAYALRALHLFYLLRAHAGMVGGELMGVPVIREYVDAYSNLNIPRSNFKDCVDSIMIDLDRALKYLPETYNDATSIDQVPQKYRDMGGDDALYNRAFGKEKRGKIDGRIIAAIKAQVSHWAASPAYQSANAFTWTEAATYAAKCLSSVEGGVSGLDATGHTWYANKSVLDKLGTNDNVPEIIWRGNIENNHTMESNNYPPSLWGNGRVNPTQNLVDAFPSINGYPINHPKAVYSAANPYENRDPRLRAYIIVNGDKQGSSSAVINTASDAKDNTGKNNLDGLNHENGKSTRTGYYLRKLTRDDINLDPNSTSDQKHLQARIRYTEIFLDYAEAANEASGPKANVGGATFSAYDVIKAIRQRAGIGVGIDGDQYLEECAADQAKMRELIRNERRLELCFENQRFWDLRRWNANLNETARGMNITTDSQTATLIYTPIATVEERKYESYMIYGPIPYSEVLKWSALQQNDGWR